MNEPTFPNPDNNEPDSTDIAVNTFAEGIGQLTDLNQLLTERGIDLTSFVIQGLDLYTKTEDVRRTEKSTVGGFSEGEPVVNDIYKLLVESYRWNKQYEHGILESLDSEFPADSNNYHTIIMKNHFDTFFGPGNLSAPIARYTVGETDPRSEQYITTLEADNRQNHHRALYRDFELADENGVVTAIAELLHVQINTNRMIASKLTGTVINQKQKPFSGIAPGAELVRLKGILFNENNNIPSIPFLLGYRQRLEKILYKSTTEFWPEQCDRFLTVLKAIVFMKTSMLKKTSPQGNALYQLRQPVIVALAQGNLDQAYTSLAKSVQAHPEVFSDRLQRMFPSRPKTTAPAARKKRLVETVTPSTGPRIIQALPDYESSGLSHKLILTKNKLLVVGKKQIQEFTIDHYGVARYTYSHRSRGKWIENGLATGTMHEIAFELPDKVSMLIGTFDKSGLWQPQSYDRVFTYPGEITREIVRDAFPEHAMQRPPVKTFVVGAELYAAELGFRLRDEQTTESEIKQYQQFITDMRVDIVELLTGGFLATDQAVRPFSALLRSDNIREYLKTLSPYDCYQLPSYQLYRNTQSTKEDRNVIKIPSQSQIMIVPSEWFSMAVKTCPTYATLFAQFNNHHKIALRQHLYREAQLRELNSEKIHVKQLLWQLIAEAREEILDKKKN